MPIKNVPTEQLAAALLEIGVPRGNQVRFLRAHSQAPGRASTASALAKIAGYKNFNGINLSYGKLAAKIRACLALPKSPGESELSLLVEFVPPPSVTNKQWVLVMRTEFAKALKLAGWV